MLRIHAARAVALALFASAVLLTGATAVAAKDVPCRKAVERAWTEAGLNPGEVASTVVAPRGYAKDSALAGDFLVTTPTQSCSGSLVVHVTGACFIRQVYTRGGCRLQNVRAFR